jgi:alpha,alpha-trehalase
MHPTPDIIFPNLFTALHLNSVLADGKGITDATPLFPPEVINAAYDKEKSAPDFDLKKFFHQHFKVNEAAESNFQSDRSKTAAEHVESLWDVLYRPADVAAPGSSIIPLPHPYIVPGGRFNEIYYWDSFFTMLGLKVSGRWGIIENMIQNFAWMIEQLGFIPNGNRSYFGSRSQPPFFAMMVSLLAKEKGEAIFQQYFPVLKKEYAFWMNGADQLTENGTAFEHLVKVEGGFLNRYYDKAHSPRQEMYRDDVELQQHSGREAEQLYLDIRSACESGWDFSSRWFADQINLSTINTSEILPVDLNCLLYNLEMTLARAAKANGEQEISATFLAKATQRKKLIQQYFWNNTEGAFFDFHFVNGKNTAAITAATVFPLCFKLATQEQALRTADFITKHLLADGGIRTTNLTSGQQWDAPNGWAPLQWITVAGLDEYGLTDLAREIARRWVHLNEQVYARTGKFVEKYNVEDLTLEAGGGEYAVQDGFGWSNGVYLALKDY